MDILPILATLRRPKVTASLLVLQIALTCAIVCNAVFLITERLHRIDMPSGIAEQRAEAALAPARESSSRSAAKRSPSRTVNP